VIAVERALDPARVRERPRTGEARASLEEDEPRPLLVSHVILAHRAGEDGQRLALGLAVIERYREFVIGQDHPVMLCGRKRGQ
jgi:hypothetical protein